MHFILEEATPKKEVKRQPASQQRVSVNPMHTCNSYSNVNSTKQYVFNIF